MNRKIPLYERLTSMDSLSYSVISYGVFYGIKHAAFLFVLFTFLIANDYIRIVSSLFYGYFIAKAMLDTSVNISEKKEWVIKSISVFDFLVLCVITDILNRTSIVDIINLLIFNAFVTYLGFWLNTVFVERVKAKQREALGKQEKADVEQNIAELKKELADYEQQKAATEHELENIKQEIADLTCPHCQRKLESKKARDAHKGRCKDNPKNQE
ncbi:hypothetical protein SAMN04489761_3023 [Tenacibaculum sp. MAR_2009_124]|uniref:hypothetical protein n=1 Tax=Tenacibaculum sp. MAR_2009_124 TaxID=1250059 RepID=UPI00089C6685|nr:hypothetical protein [Tenacibaculum sp. MAR_2009_124]SEC44921.1 hypothetical protein SAMN04489761_3023 [Tenacibaculum sp. MAR_2009_124]